MVEMQYKLDPSLMLSYSAIKCTHHCLHQLSPTMTTMIGDNENRENCDDHIIMIGVMLMISTAKSPSPHFIFENCLFLALFYCVEQTISMIPHHLKNLRCHPCLPSCRHPWTSCYLHLKDKKVHLWESFGLLDIGHLFSQKQLSLSQEHPTWFSLHLVSELSQKNRFSNPYIHTYRSLKKPKSRIFYSWPDDMAASTASCTCLQDPCYSLNCWNDR